MIHVHLPPKFLKARGLALAIIDSQIFRLNAIIVYSTCQLMQTQRLYPDFTQHCHTMPGVDGLEFEC